MKKIFASYLIILGILVLMPGCVSIPPLIQVEHKETVSPSTSNDDIKRRLDSIDRRLDKMEKDIKAKPSE